MAKIVITGLPKPYSNRTYTYTDIHLDLREQYLINDNLNQRPEINDLMVDHDIDAIKNSIKNIFYTAPGEKILSQDFGLDLRQFLFEQVTTDNSNLIQRIIFNELGIYEPRIVVKAVNVVPNFDQDEYSITMIFDVPTLDISNVSLFGSLNKNGYFYV